MESGKQLADLVGSKICVQLGVCDPESYTRNGKTVPELPMVTGVLSKRIKARTYQYVCKIDQSVSLSQCGFEGGLNGIKSGSVILLSPTYVQSRPHSDYFFDAYSNNKTLRVAVFYFDNPEVESDGLLGEDDIFDDSSSKKMKLICAGYIKFTEHQEGK